MIPFILAAILWDKLPDKMADHWGIKGEPDGYASKGFASLFLPAINIGGWLLVLILPRFDPKFAAYDEETKASLRRTFSDMRGTVAVFLSVMSVGILLTPLWPAIRVPVIANVGCGLMMMVLGNLMSKLRPNYFFGIRTRSTFGSREIWTKTHRLGGRLMMLAGLGIFVFGLILPMKLLLFCVLLPAIALIAIVPTVYAYVLSKRIPR